MAHLQLRYSEAYDASIAFWVGALDETYFNQEYDRWVQEYVRPAQGFVAKAQQAWDRINDQVFGCFQRFGYEFAPDEWPAYAIHCWPKVSPYKDPITFFIVEDLDEVALVLIHEWAHCHEDYPGSQAVYEPVREHIFARFAAEPIAVQYHLITIWVQWAVMKQVFPDRWQILVGRTVEHPLLQRVAEILASHEDQLSYDDPLGSLLAW